MQDQNHTGVKTYPASFDGKAPATTTGAWVHVKSKDEGVLHDPSYGNDEEAKTLPVRIHEITKDENKGLSHATVSFDASAPQAQATRSPTRTGGHSAAEMAHKNAMEAARSATKIAEHIKKGGKVPPWVAHKLSVVRTHLGDVKHAGDYHEKYGKPMPEPEHPEPGVGGYRNRSNVHIQAEKQGMKVRIGNGKIFTCDSIQSGKFGVWCCPKVGGCNLIAGPGVPKGGKDPGLGITAKITSDGVLVETRRGKSYRTKVERRGAPVSRRGRASRATGSTVDTLRRQGARVAGCGGRKK